MHKVEIQLVSGIIIINTLGLTMNEFRKRAKNLLLIDIETVASVADFSQLSPRMQSLWNKKASQLQNPDLKTPADLFNERGGIYAEFGKVVCIAFGAFFWNEQDELSLKVKSISGDDESELLKEFNALLDKYPQQQLVLCAHNGKEFDFPYLCRRMLIQGITVPECLRISGKKPWEVLHQDTMEMWKFGDYKSFTSLDLLAAVLNIESSKTEISGDQVSKVYYDEKDLAKISRYCREDVVVLSKIYLKLQTDLLLEDEHVYRIG